MVLQNGISSPLSDPAVKLSDLVSESVVYESFILFGMFFMSCLLENRINKHYVKSAREQRDGS
jgi:hypothetical protein